MTIKIETYHAEHLSQVIDLILDIQKNEFGIDITLEQQPDLLAIPKVYQIKNGNFWVALIEQKVVGTIALIDIGIHQVALRKMFVSQSFRGAEPGVAKHLLNQAKYWSCAKGVQDVFLGTTPSYHAAHRFYEKNGFLEIPKIELPASFPLMDVDKKFYHLHLTYSDIHL